jgi:hypothetical protein
MLGLLDLNNSFDLPAINAAQCLGVFVEEIGQSNGTR